MKRALIYVPEDRRLDSDKAQENASYLARRGYQLFALVRRWSLVDELLRRGDVDTVVFGECHSALPGEETRVLTGDRTIAVADAGSRRMAIGGDGAQTQPLGEGTRVIAMRADPGAETQQLGHRAWNAERLGRVIDSDGQVPTGLDPESIAAARRIARALNQGHTR